MTSLQEALKAIVPADQGVACPYCGKRAKIVTGDVIYPHRKDLADQKFHLCTPCEAYVGCHDKSSKRKRYIQSPSITCQYVAHNFRGS